MNNYQIIIETFNAISQPKEGFSFRLINNSLWGKSCDGWLSFGLKSSETSQQTLSQSTKLLNLVLNATCEITDSNGVYDEKMSILVLKSTDRKLMEIFIRLSDSFAENLSSNDYLKYFLYLKELFSSDRKTSMNELQGLYGELYTMYYFIEEFNVDISSFYQSIDKMTFDFSITADKKIDVKTTTKPVRIHHFIKEQLNTKRFDINIVSILLKKDDIGLSLLELVNICKRKFSQYFSLILHIELMIKNIDDTDLESIKFDSSYSHANLKIYKGIEIPRIHEKTNEGVFNVEFDSDLTNCDSLSRNDILNWLLSK